jgi:hypothetical protein
MAALQGVPLSLVALFFYLPPGKRHFLANYFAGDLKMSAEFIKHLESFPVLVLPGQIQFST